MARRSPSRKVTYFEPVPSRLARNTIIESTFEVGRRFRCTLRVDCGQLDPRAVIRPPLGEWQSPDAVPPRWGPLGLRGVETIAHDPAVAAKLAPNRVADAEEPQIRWQQPAPAPPAAKSSHRVHRRRERR
jgi:hypothetical protein